jgi:hypothetical protein
VFDLGEAEGLGEKFVGFKEIEHLGKHFNVFLLNVFIYV